MEELVNKKSLDEQKELYFASIIHDLKNPLNAQIVSLNQLYQEKFGGINHLQKEILYDIISSSEYMRSLLVSLLAVFKFENGDVKLHNTQVDIDKLLNNCIKDFTAIADEHCIFIQYFKNAKQSEIMCDFNYMKRLIYNMLNNLISYSYKNTKPMIFLEDDEKYLILRFKSNGYPIDDELKAHIFDKYVSGYSKKSGTGIGLYLCKKIAEAHGGNISLNSHNSDIEFCIKLPKVNCSNNIIKFN